MLIPRVGVRVASRVPGPGEQEDRAASGGEQTLTRLAGLTRDLDEVVAASRDTNADDEHDPEGATIAFERQQVSALLSQAEASVAAVEAALAAHAAGTYGRCERCGCEIGAERLEARPSATTCISCARSRG